MDTLMNNEQRIEVALKSHWSRSSIKAMHLINGSPTNATQACMHDRMHVMLGEGTLCWRLFPAGNDKFRGCLIDTIRNGPRIHWTFVRLDL